MKKVILSVAIALTAVTGAFAQKQEGGEKNLEVNFTPLSGSPVGVDGVRLRLFNADGTGAIRVRLGLGGTNVQTVNSQSYILPQGADNITVPELYDTEKSFNFSIRPGYEIHFEGTDRLSPYVGGEIIFATGSETLTREFRNGSSAESNADAAKWSTWEAVKKSGTTTFGLGAVAGFDYYFADNLYLGAEIGFGWQNKKYKDLEVTLANESYIYSTGESGAQTDSDFSDWVYIENNKVVNRTVVGDGKGNFKESGWGPSYQATLRLGWLF